MDLRAKPFYLDDAQVEWVDATLNGMTTDEKIEQLFLLNSKGDETAEQMIERTDEAGIQPCGFLLRGASSHALRDKIRRLQEHYAIPLFIAGDLDRGASNMIQDGTALGHQMQLGATGDPELAYKAGFNCARECAAVGANWNFGPVVDIDLNPRNPITNVRSFGSDASQVLRFASAAARGMRDGGIIPCVKHWPGDGVDERDQHFLASVNSLGKDEWDATYGRVYQGMIDDGIETLMTAHIMLPAYSRYYNPDISDEDILPGSLNKELHNRLLRGQMGFNGLIITDSTSMGGFTECMPRSRAVPLCIENGADIFLFFRNLAEDILYMKQGLESGILSHKRLDEAVRRILALKAKLRLPEKRKNKTLTPPEADLDIFKAANGARLASEIADRGITLVKDTQQLLPLSPQKHGRIFMIVIGDKPGYHNPLGGYAKLFISEMEKRGFQITVYGEDNAEPGFSFERAGIAEVRARYDLILYFCNVQSSGSDSAARIVWPGLRATIPTLIHDVPTLMVSIDNPYHLMDAPRIPTYVNAYTSSDTVVKALAEKLSGESTFKGKSPVDAFAGLFSAKL